MPVKIVAFRFLFPAYTRTKHWEGRHGTHDKVRSIRDEKGKFRVGYLKHAARCVLGFCIAFATLTAFAVDPPQVTAGLSWLSGRVQQDGSLAGESASRGSAFQARVETLTTLRQLASAPTALADRVSQDSTAAVEVLARKAAVLAPLGRDTSTTISALLARQNADGGFGGASGYQSNTLDTAYALRALKAASPASAAIGPAIDYLKAVQASSGAFAIAGEDSIFVTAEALQAMAAFAATQQVATSIASARSWLLAQQQQGSYNDTLKNAVGVLALLSASNDTAGLPAVVGALAASQLADGSWEGDPYLTALALRALGAAAQVLPIASTGQVSGTVLADATGAPLDGVSISLAGPATAGGLTCAANHSKRDHLS